MPLWASSGPVGPPGRRVAARPITGVEPREDTGSHRRPVPPVVAPAPPPPGRVRRLLSDRAPLARLGAHGRSTPRSSPGCRSCATAASPPGASTSGTWCRRCGAPPEGRLLDTTDVSGVQFSRLGAHVDPVLVLFAPLWWVWSSPEMLLVAQAVIVATGALPAFWLGRRWLGDDRLALAGAAAYLLYPALRHATLFDFHPVTLAAPLLLFCIWAAEEARWVTLGGLRRPGRALPGAGRACCSPPSRCGSGSATPSAGAPPWSSARRRPGLGRDRGRRDHAGASRIEASNAAHRPLLAPRRRPRRDRPDLPHAPLGGRRDPRHARAAHVPARAAAAAAAAAARRAAAGRRRAAAAR